jgi:hypothetical protein
MKKKIKEHQEINKWNLELTEEQLRLISRAIEFVSRFSCGQIGFSYLPHDIQETFYKRDENNELDWIEINQRKNQFDAIGGLMKTTLYPELNPLSYEHYGVNKSDYADNLYDIYKMINHKLHEYDNINTSPDEIHHNVNSHFTKFGSLPNIKVIKIEE